MATSEGKDKADTLKPVHALAWQCQFDPKPNAREGYRRLELDVEILVAHFGVLCSTFIYFKLGQLAHDAGIDGFY